jgi:hypothetical protein
MKYLKLFENWNYSDNNYINSLIKNARKWSEKDFIEEYVYLNDINIDSGGAYIKNINKGDKVKIVRIKRDDLGKEVYKDSIRQYTPYKTVVAEKDYNDNQWHFIMVHTKELQEEARELYYQNKNNKKPIFNGSKTIEAYHASKNKFSQFKYGMESPSQIGSDSGYFFFLNKKNAEYLASVIKDNNGEAYLYTVDVQIGKQLKLNGEDIGTNWGRQGELSQAEIEGYKTVIITDADTGYGIIDELVVFDDDNIKIKVVKKL